MESPNSARLLMECAAYSRNMNNPATVPTTQMAVNPFAVGHIPQENERSCWNDISSTPNCNPAACILSNGANSEDPKLKPSLSYIALIYTAITSSPDRMLTLSGIYKYITDNFKYYEKHKHGWKNSIRHNLSLNDCFVKINRSASNPGKGCYWAIHPKAEHMFEDGSYLRRKRRFKLGEDDINEFRNLQIRANQVNENIIAVSSSSEQPTSTQQAPPQYIPAQNTYSYAPQSTAYMQPTNSWTQHMNGLHQSYAPTNYYSNMPQQAVTSYHQYGVSQQLHNNPAWYNGNYLRQQQATPVSPHGQSRISLDSTGSLLRTSPEMGVPCCISPTEEAKTNSASLSAVHRAHSSDYLDPYFTQLPF
ncbi:unnamed protein product [Rodentolepis nana]|uniref:Fork-head domain-containing protein n=1 Tax=Rodentolepis nana TaxID=102285 RepID=A0A0R3T1J3_RODNA|nr:unnamed protein product [Rodentolepis nana]